jgi:hypothetical protein
MSTRSRWLAAILTAFAAMLAGPAVAAPQILGLVASSGLPTPLRCQDGSCSGSLASFCLQAARDAPLSGSFYRLAAGARLTLLATTADGRRLALPAADLLAFRSRHGFTTIEVSLPAPRLADLGLDLRRLTSLAVDVGPEATLLPVAAADDRDPQSPAEVAQASGPLRRLAAGIFDQPGEAVDAARLVGLVVDQLPAEAEAPVALDGVWRQVAGAAAGKVGSAGLAAAGRVVDACRRSVITQDSFALGVCLDMQEAGLMATLNRRFWDEAGGS